MEKKPAAKFKKGDMVSLVEDKGNEVYTIEEVTDKFSKGPMSQFPESRVYKLTDGKNHHWQFREDSLKLAAK